jgi:subtilase family serine protease
MLRRAVFITFICCAVLSFSMTAQATEPISPLRKTPPTSKAVSSQIKSTQVPQTAAKNIQPLAPDLIVQSIRINPPNPKNGGQPSATDFGPGFLVYATILNQGQVEAFLPKGWRLSASRIVELNGNYNSFIYGETNNITLVPGASIEVLAGNFRSQTLSPAGTWMIMVKANPDNQVPESNYANNEKSTQVTVANVNPSAPPPPTDLIISDLRINTTNATIDGNFKLIAVVKNNGGTAANIPPYWKGINFDNGDGSCGMLSNSGSVTLQPGQTLEFQCNPIRLQVGTFTWTVTADPQKKVFESSAPNNTKTIQVTINQR